MRSIVNLSRNLSSKMSKHNILQEFIEKHKHLPKQGSEKWLSQRKFTVGGSQIATIMGINKYENIKGFIKTKMDMYTFKKGAPLWFGTLMEYGVQQYVEIEFRTKLFETGSLPCEFNKYISYSPDGLCIISNDKLKKIINQKQIDDVYQSSNVGDNINCENCKKETIVLMEFKSPFMRKIVQGEMPDYYKPQPLLGMEVIDIAEMSIFIECVFRFCSFKDLYNTKYSYYHFDKERYNKEAMMYSAISLFYKESDSDNEGIQFILDNIEEFKNSQYGGRYKEGDLSSISDRNIINKILELSKECLHVEYHSMYSNRKEDYESENNYTFNMFNNPIKFVNEVKKIKEEKSSEYKYLGTLCYKLLEVNQIPMFKEKILTEELNNKIEKVFEIVKKVTEESKDIKDPVEFEKYWKAAKIPTNI
jgi:YqaJ-like viral recombinase domain